MVTTPGKIPKPEFERFERGPVYLVCGGYSSPKDPVRVSDIDDNIGRFDSAGKMLALGVGKFRDDRTPDGERYCY